MTERDELEALQRRADDLELSLERVERQRDELMAAVRMMSAVSSAALSGVSNGGEQEVPDAWRERRVGL